MYLRRTEELQDLLSRGDGSAVILNDPDDESVPLAVVLQHLLSGRTHSFTALVGYFGHRIQKDVIARYEDVFQVSGLDEMEGEDPAGLIVHEAIDENVQQDRDFEHTAFRLLAGAMSSNAAQDAARAWYWLCRFRHEAPEGEQMTDKLRDEFLRRTVGPDHSFVGASISLLQPRAYDDSPFNLEPAEFAEQLEVSDTTSHLAKHLRSTLFEIIDTDESTNAKKGAAILLGFFLQRCTDFRLNPQQHRGSAIFHPKIYVVERGEDDLDGQTGTIVGSHNWTAPGLGLVDEPDDTNTNVEVATFHIDRGHRWKNQPESVETSLGNRVCATAHKLFDSAKFTLGAWNRRPDDLLPAAKLQETTQNCAGRPDLNRKQTTQETFRSLLVYLRHLVARLGHINLDEHHDEFFDRFRLTGQFESTDESDDYGVLFGGKIPASYQIDGAIRLLSMLEGTGDGNGSRGAFLTDEAGLGKTLSAKMTLAVLAATRLAKRSHDDHPLKVSLIVPASLTGSEARGGRAPSGWHLHAREFRRATRALLADVCEDINADQADRLTGDDHLHIRVLSQGIFSPDEDILPDAKNRKDIPANDVFTESSDARLADFQHIAESELVAIDESHAFRNQRSRRTRTLRLLLSLPVPGEDDWRIVPPSGETVEPADDLPDDIHRRVLFLSATPFNNRIEDIITQIGHFAQYQNWQMPYGTVGQLELAGDEFQRPLDEAIAAWQTATDESARTDAFRTIVKYARRHLHRTRTLSVPADKLEEEHRQGNTDELRSRYDDLGPEYIWGEDSANYRTAFAKALRWMDDEQRSRRESVDREQLELERFEARQELESVLTSLFVQRSRIRALRIIEAAGATISHGDAGDSSAMFRKPRRPRQPLALNRHHRAAESDEQTIEAGILDNLFRLLYPSDTGEDGDDISESGEVPQLSLKAYEISALRGQRSAQAASNAIGFQITNLIKRLQSAPYSFFRTLVNGVFRRSLTELALVERLLDDVKTGEVELPASIDADELRDRMDELTDQLDTGNFPRLSNVIQLIGGDLDPHGYGRPSMTRLAGLQPDGHGNRSHPHAQDVDEHYAELCELLADDRQRLLWDPEAAGDLADDERQGWVSLLLEQIEAGPDSELWRDITTVLEVTEELSDQIWGRGKQNVGKPFDDIWRDFRDMPTSSAPGVADWLVDRLDADERTRTLMAWLLVQSAARTTSEDHPVRSLIRGGSRTLIFTEYKDTQDYLLALFAALDVVFRDPAASGRYIEELRDALCDEMRRVASDLTEQSERVANADVERFHFADPTNFASPVTDGLEGWLNDWLHGVDNDPKHFSRAVTDLCETFVRVHGDEADRLLPDDDIEPHVNASGDEPSLQNLSLDTQVDAFSPWYQLEPESDIDDPAEALGYVERLHEAAAFPVHTLLTTDVLAEGVNLQECGVVVHFDLPWNPTKLIQRNGRIDRRLNPAFERTELREKLHDQLVDTAFGAADFDDDRRWESPDFHSPEQVYHLTVLPIEPRVLRSGADPELATRVRESLQTKLEAIRTLFGLSNWPIVLTYEDTQEVLTGELDFETPGFRRREDLFAAFRQLEESATTANERFKSIDAQLSVHLAAPPTARTRLLELFADSNDPGVADAWEHVRAAGIVSWTKPTPRSMTVRSDNEWVAALKGDLGAVSGVLVVEDDNADGGFAFVTWGVARGTSGRDTTGRRILPAYIRPTDVDAGTADAHFLELAELEPLDDWQSLEGAAPNAPSELAADLVKTIIDLAVDGEPIEQDRERKDEAYPADDIDADIDDSLIDFLGESSFLNTVIDSQYRPVSARPGFGTEPNRVALSIDPTDPEADAEPAFNLWITFDE